jgi:tRNA 5-methylaminomethyl-2-thiouridine biosynthesis bifunctional protein
MPDPLIPATVAFRADGTPYSPRYNDIYHSAVGSLAQAQYVFLQGNGLPGRWQQQRTFTVLEIGFGMGVNFLTNVGCLACRLGAVRAPAFRIDRKAPVFGA